MSTGDPFGAGDTSTLPEHRSVADAIHDRRLRRGGLLAVWLLLAVALAGFLGVRMGSASAEADGWTLQVDHPQISRPALDAPVTITVGRDGGLPPMVRIRVPRVLLEHLDVNLISPAPSAETGAGEYVEWSFEPPADGELVVSVDARLSPAQMAGLDRFDVAVVDGDGVVLVGAPLTFVVLP